MYGPDLFTGAAVRAPERVLHAALSSTPTPADNDDPARSDVSDGHRLRRRQPLHAGRLCQRDVHPCLHLPHPRGRASLLSRAIGALPAALDDEHDDPDRLWNLLRHHWDAMHRSGVLGGHAVRHSQ